MNSNNPKKRRTLSSRKDSNPSKRRRINESHDDEEEKKSEKSSTNQQFKQSIIKSRLEAAQNALDYLFDETRIRCKQDGAHGIPPTNMKVTGVIYWMSGDQRVQDNWAMLYSQRMAIQHKVPLFVVFCLQPTFLGATIRHFDFMLKGLQEIENELISLNIPFKLLFGEQKQILPSFAIKNNCNLIITDFSPLRISKQWLLDVGTESDKENIHLTQVDAHNIVPVWVASNKQEYAARTIRSKINRNLAQYLTQFPPVIKHSFNGNIDNKQLINWNEARSSLEVDMNVTVVRWCKPGTNHGINELYNFITKRLKNYEKDRNIPTKDGVSNLSPWYHFGQLSTQRAALEVNKYSNKYTKSVQGYLEEMIVRRELSDNFCFYNKNYDKICGASQWAQDTLEVHEDDEREYIYTLNEFETYQTHDDLWNAAQKQMVIDGKMHGFLRMYWAKKILEWTTTPTQALQTAIYLNDKYSMDGRDANGYVGCMWSICGIHDQGWKERPIFGKIRFMNYNGCKRKFDVKAFVTKMGIK